MGDEPKTPGRMRVPELVLVCVGIGLLLLLGLRALLDSVSWPRHTKSSEAKANLKALFVLQRVFRHEKDRYSPRVYELGFAPERGNRYAYFLQASGPIELRDDTEMKLNEEVVIIWIDRGRFKTAPAPTDFAGMGCPLTFGKDAEGRPVGLGVSGTLPNDAFIAVAAGNLDADAELDCWSIASMPRVDANGEPIPAGMPHHEQDDTPPTRWERIKTALFGRLF